MKWISLKLRGHNLHFRLSLIKSKWHFKIKKKKSSYQWGYSNSKITFEHLSFLELGHWYGGDVLKQELNQPNCVFTS